MKIFVKLISLLVVLGLAGPFFLRGPDQRPLMDYRDFVPDVSAPTNKVKRWWGEVADNTPESQRQLQTEEETEIDTSGKIRVYKWQDDNGNWQFSGRKPNGRTSETVWLNPNENIVASGANARQGNDSDSDQNNGNGQTPDEEDNSPQSRSIGLPLPLTISPSELSELVDDVDKLKEIMEKRNEVLDKEL